MARIQSISPPARLNILRALLITAILLVTPALGYIAVSRRVDPAFVLGALVGVLALVVWQRRGSHFYEFGILAIVLTGGLVSFFTLPTGRESRIVVSLLITLILLLTWLFHMGWVERRLAVRPSPINRPVFAFVAVMIISYFWSLAFRDPLMFIWSSFPMVQVVALLVNVTFPLLLLMVANKLNEPMWISRLVIIFILLGVTSIVLYFTNQTIHDWFMYRGTRGLFSMWVAAFALSLALFQRKLPTWLRVLLVGLVIVLIYRYFFLGRSWVSGWLPMFVALMVIVYQRSKRAFVILAVLGAIYVSLNFTYYFNNIVLAEEQEGSGTGRVELWERNLGHVANHPLFGVGPAGYAIYNMTYHPSDARSTHNNYFDVLAQTGIVGFAAFLWLFGTLIHLARRTRSYLDGRSDLLEAFSVATLAGGIATMVGMMLGDWVLPFAYNQTIAGFDNAAFTWILLGAMVALYHMAEEGKLGQASMPASETAGGS